MRSSREPDPSLMAQRAAKRRTITQIPRNLMSVNVQVSTAKILANFVRRNPKPKRVLSPVAEFHAIRPISLNETLRLPLGWKPRCPHLHRHPAGITRTPRTPRIHQQIAEPPGRLPEPHANKPDLVSPSSRQRGVNLVQSFFRRKPAPDRRRENKRFSAKNVWHVGAGDGDRTRDIQLGKLAFYR